MDYFDDVTSQRTVLPRARNAGDTHPYLRGQSAVPFSSLMPSGVRPLKRAKVYAVVNTAGEIDAPDFLKAFNARNADLALIDLYFAGGLDAQFNVQQVKGARFSDVLENNLETKILRDNLLQVPGGKLLSNNYTSPHPRKLEKVVLALQTLASVEQRIVLATNSLLLHYTPISSLVDELILMLEPTPRAVANAIATMNAFDLEKVKVRPVKMPTRSRTTKKYRDKQVERFLGEKFTKLGGILE